jgi:hypothetical protein
MGEQELGLNQIQAFEPLSLCVNGGYAPHLLLGRVQDRLARGAQKGLEASCRWVPMSQHAPVLCASPHIPLPLHPFVLPHWPPPTGQPQRCAPVGRASSQ